MEVEVQRIQRSPYSGKISGQLPLPLHADALGGKQTLNVKQVILHIMPHRAHSGVELFNLPDVSLHLINLACQKCCPLLILHRSNELLVDIISVQNTKDGGGSNKKNQKIQRQVKKGIAAGRPFQKSRIDKQRS